MFLSILAAILASIVLFLVARRKKAPEWLTGHEETYKKWTVISLFSAIGFGSALGIVAGFAQDIPFFWHCALGALSSIIAFVFTLSLWTDHKFRKVDRILLRYAIIIALTLGVIQLFMINNETFTVIYIMSILLSSVIFFTPIGSSDARTYILFFAAAYPILGINLTFYAFASGIGFILLYGVISAIKNKKMLVSIPLVPYILAPYIGFTIYGTVILI